jgi:hypothetical protein
MWNRACPLCFVKTPRALVLTRSEDLACPSCHAPLEISRPSRALSAAVGLLAAYILVRITGNAETRTTIAWVLPLAEAVFAYGVASALTLFFLADLVARPKPPSSSFPQVHS